MFSLLKKLPQQMLHSNGMNYYKASIGLIGEKCRFISTSDSMQTPEKLSKTTPRIGGLPTDLVNEQKLKKTTRTLSTLQDQSAAPLASRVTVSKDEGRNFMAVWPDVLRDLSQYCLQNKCKEATDWFTKVLQYNVPHGKNNRGILTVIAYKNLVSEELQTPENIRLAQYLGWCVEMLQTFLIMADDIMDNSTTRRGQTCWHILEDVGLIAINDSVMVENGIYSLLKKHFRHLDCYVDLIELFHDVTFITTFGQSMDVLNSHKSVDSFQMDKYKTIVSNKTSYYTFYLPFALAMHLAGVKDAEAYRQSKMILMEMGHFFQVQDDFLDCYGNPEVTGKVGTDIEDNKCSWLAVVCMQRANDEQKRIMVECYGQRDPAKVARVKELYKELGLPNTYATYEEESYNMIKTHIQQTSRGVPHETFLKILNKIYQRSA